MWVENGRPNFRGLFTTKVIKSHVKLHLKSDAQITQVNKAIGFPNTYPLDSDLAGG